MIQQLSKTHRSQVFHQIKRNQRFRNLHEANDSPRQWRRKQKIRIANRAETGERCSRQGMVIHSK